MKAPGLRILRPATQISNRLIHHSSNVNTLNVVTLVLHLDITHIHVSFQTITREFTPFAHNECAPTHTHAH